MKGWQHGGQRTRRSHIVTATHHYNSNKEDWWRVDRVWSWESGVVREGWWSSLLTTVSLYTKLASDQFKKNNRNIDPLLRSSLGYWTWKSPSRYSKRIQVLEKRYTFAGDIYLYIILLGICWKFFVIYAFRSILNHRAFSCYLWINALQDTKW